MYIKADWMSEKCLHCKMVAKILMVYLILLTLILEASVV